MTGNYRRRSVLVLLAIAVACGGCITTQPTLDSTTTDPAVFESISTGDSWGTSSLQTSVTLAPGATTSEGVTDLSVVTANGSSFYTTSLDAGQTSVTLPLPMGSSQIIATNTVNGTTVGTANVTVSGNTYP
ncbi:hypothetical protein [Halococcus salsus]|uniref:hypothetical protein n=1 Tax=Halococcus salsus TaxID=2162894 RepID=UPI001357AD9B|nr:hypothetical protein [Halococcus salsus]